MIITLVLNFIASFIGMVMSIVPEVTIGSVPIVGPFIVTYLGMAVGYWNTFEGILPYVGIVKDMFVYVIIPFEVTLLLVKVFFGSRTPAHMN